MSAICNSKKLLVILSALLTLVVMLSFMTVSVPAEETGTAEAQTGSPADTSEGTGTTAGTAAADSTAVTTADTAAGTSASTETETTAPAKVDHTKGIINLIVGGVLLVAIIVLACVFRKKIPGWYKDVKSECKKIVWCPKDKLRKNSLVVIVIILAVTIAVGLLDFAFSDGIILLGKLFD